MTQLDDTEKRFLTALYQALNFEHPDLPIAAMEEALTAPNFNRIELYNLIKTCPSLFTQFETAQKEIKTNAEKSKGLGITPRLEGLNQSEKDTILENKFPELRKAIIAKLEEPNPETPLKDE